MRNAFRDSNVDQNLGFILLPNLLVVTQNVFLIKYYFVLRQTAHGKTVFGWRSPLPPSIGMKLPAMH